MNWRDYSRIGEHVLAKLDARHRLAIRWTAYLPLRVVPAMTFGQLRGMDPPLMSEVYQEVASHLFVKPSATLP